MTIKRILLPLIALACAGAVWFSSAGSALAPSPAQATQPLASGTNATAAAVYVNTSTPTKIIYWPASASSDANPPAVGTPCSPGGMAPGGVTFKVIVATHGNYRKCV